MKVVEENGWEGWFRGRSVLGGQRLLIPVGSKSSALLHSTSLLLCLSFSVSLSLSFSISLLLSISHYCALTPFILFFILIHPFTLSCNFYIRSSFHLFVQNYKFILFYWHYLLINFWNYFLIFYYSLVIYHFLFAFVNLIKTRYQ